jgi:hypothetical protein
VPLAVADSVLLTQPRIHPTRTANVPAVFPMHGFLRFKASPRRTTVQIPLPARLGARCALPHVDPLPRDKTRPPDRPGLLAGRGSIAPPTTCTAGAAGSCKGIMNRGLCRAGTQQNRKRCPIDQNALHVLLKLSPRSWNTGTAAPPLPSYRRHPLEWHDTGHGC